MKKLVRWLFDFSGYPDQMSIREIFVKWPILALIVLLICVWISALFGDLIHGN